MTGAEIAWRTLAREPVDEPCLIACWMMKREFFRRYAGVSDTYADPVRTAVEAFAAAGCNLNPQFIIPSPIEEHLARSPWNLPPKPWVTGGPAPAPPPRDLSPEQVRDEVEALPEADRQMQEFDPGRAAADYARGLVQLREMSRDQTLYIGGFHMPSFMGGYTRWTYESYLSALYLYPDQFRRYFRIEAEKAQLHNRAICQAVATGKIAPVVYSGDDICFNNGPICSMELLDNLYFPALRHAIEPLVEAGIEIVWHCDGNVLPLVPRLIAMGITGFQGFQEREAHIPLETMVQFRRRDGGKLIFFGSVSVVHTFPHGTAADMRREVERCFQVAGPGGGFCLAPSSSILPETPMENIVTFMEYGREYGRKFLREGGPAAP